MVKNYKDLHVWQKGMELVKDVYVLTNVFPAEELFGLVSQMRRSAISIPSNIAEGWMRQHTKEYIQFIHHALGSCGEVDTQLTIAVELHYVEKGMAAEIFDKVNHISRML